MIRRFFVLAVFVSVIGAAGATLAQGPQLSRIMREKLVYARGMLDAVVTANWTELETHAKNLEKLTTSPGWTVLKYPEYAKHSAAFVSSLQDLQRVATEKDSGKATDAYTAIVKECVNCHRYVARARIARTP